MVDPETIEQRMKDFRDACSHLGVRATHQRLEIFREVAQSEDHPDVETVFNNVRRRIPTISLDTVYRTLAMLGEKGIIARVHVLQERGRYDANMDDHHHFVCTECGMIRDFYSHDLDDLEIPREVGDLGLVDRRHIELRGTCRSCLVKKEKGKK